MTAPTITIRRTASSVMVEVDAGDLELPAAWLSRWRLAVQQAAQHPDDFGSSDRSFASARVRARRSDVLLALIEELRPGSTTPDRPRGRRA